MKPDTYYSNARFDVVDVIPGGQYSSILEIGGGDFPTLRMLGDRNHAQIWGVDVRAPVTALPNFILGSITDEAVIARLPEAGFDLILANDVIEHIESTEAFFDAVYGLLKDDGIAALSVPNIRQIRTVYQLFVRGTFPRNDAGLFDRTHLRWFCKGDVIRLARNAGLTLELARSSGRLVPRLLARSVVGELLGLQNLFVFRKCR